MRDSRGRERHLRQNLAASIAHPCWQVYELQNGFSNHGAEIAVHDYSRMPAISEDHSAFVRSR